MHRVGEEKLQHSAQRGTLAIDLGSTNTVVAFQSPEDDGPKLLDLPPISRSPGEIPSLVWSGGDQPLIGQAVVDADRADLDDPRLARDFKRSIGASDSDGTAETAGTALLHQIWSHLPAQLSVERLVLSAPVEHYRSYRQWLLKACEQLPAEEIALVDEPTAAALGAGLPAGSKLLVVDLGGSTLDLALVALEGGEGRAAPIAQLLRLGGQSLGMTSKQKLRTARVLGKSGLRLGGRDIDRWIAEACCPGITPSTAVLNAAERLKCQLSNPDLRDDQSLEEEIRTIRSEAPTSLRLSRRELERLLDERGLADALARLLEEALTGGRQHHCDLPDLQGVIAVGGGARLPWLQRWLAEHTAPAPRLTPPPMEAVAVGALKLTPGVTIKDVLHHGVSLRVWDQRAGCHRWHPLFLAGQPWPSSDALTLTLAASQAGQRQLELILGEPSVEGRHDVIYIDGIPTLQSQDAGEANHLPWEEPPCILPIDPPGEAGMDCLKLELRLNGEAQLLAQITDLRSGRTWSGGTLGTVR